MAASTPVPPTIYLGTFVHSKSLSELEICDQGAIGVDSAGVIKFVERDVVRIEDVKAKYEEWEDAEVVRVEDGFFFPGFIGMYDLYIFVGRVDGWFVEKGEEEEET